MNQFLLDTHVFLWWVFNDDRLSWSAREIIKSPSNHVFLSAASAWEISTKHRIGKLPQAGSVVTELPHWLARARINPLSISIEDSLLAGSMDHVHRDPFDRMIAAQGQLRRVPIVSNDPVFKALSSDVVW